MLIYIFFEENFIKVKHDVGWTHKTKNILVTHIHLNSQSTCIGVVHIDWIARQDLKRTILWERRIYVISIIALLQCGGRILCPLLSRDTIYEVVLNGCAIYKQSPLFSTQTTLQHDIPHFLSCIRSWNSDLLSFYHTVLPLYCWLHLTYDYHA